jgi:hypothetical protein
MNSARKKKKRQNKRLSTQPSTASIIPMAPTVFNPTNTNERLGTWNEATNELEREMMLAEEQERGQAEINRQNLEGLLEAQATSRDSAPRRDEGPQEVAVESPKRKARPQALSANEFRTEWKKLGTAEEQAEWRESGYEVSRYQSILWALVAETGHQDCNQCTSRGVDCTPSRAIKCQPCQDRHAPCSWVLDFRRWRVLRACGLDDGECDEMIHEAGVIEGAAVERTKGKAKAREPKKSREGTPDEAHQRAPSQEPKKKKARTVGIKSPRILIPPRAHRSRPETVEERQEAELATLRSQNERLQRKVEEAREAAGEARVERDQALKTVEGCREVVEQAARARDELTRRLDEVEARADAEDHARAQEALQRGQPPQVGGDQEAARWARRFHRE